MDGLPQRVKVVHVHTRLNAEQTVPVLVPEDHCVNSVLGADGEELCRIADEAAAQYNASRSRS